MRGKSPLKIWIMGAGGVGAIVGGRLVSSIPDILFIDGWIEHVAALQNRGLRIDYPDKAVETGPLRAVHTDGLSGISERPDIVLLCLKSYDTDAAAGQLELLLGPESIVVSLQNGVNIDAIAGHIGVENTVGASVLFDGELLAPGLARQARIKPLILGEAAGPVRGRTRSLADLLQPVAPIRLTSDIRNVLWSKLVNNTCNGLAAVTGLGLGRILERPELMELWIGLAAEAIRVARAADIIVIADQTYGAPPDAYLADPGSSAGLGLRSGLRREFAPYPELKSTMLQDIEKGRRTEIDDLSGHVVRSGRKVGIGTPLNEGMVRLVHLLEAGQRPSLKSLTALVDDGSGS